MNIVVIGTGYVGLVTGTCLAKLKHNVTCIDINEEKISKLKDGVIPIYEPGIEELVNECCSDGTLSFGTKLSDYIENADVVFCAVGTPPDEDGSADLKYVLSAARDFGRCVRKYSVFVTKSTVPVGTSEKVYAAIKDEIAKRNVDKCFDVASNPEFLKEGSAIGDFMNPDRVVIGSNSQMALDYMKKVYEPMELSDSQLICCDIKSAEMIKYAANSMLATRISFMNDIANLCEIVGADVLKVKEGIGADTRIGKKFLMPGCGYGGSCFPKDVKALIHTAEENGYSMDVLKSVEEVNRKQKEKLFNDVEKHFNGELGGKTIGILGLAFKPNTDDMREATSLVLIDKFLNCGCTVKVYDPIAMNECKRRIGDVVKYCNDVYETCEKCDAVCLVTEWDEIKHADYEEVKKIMNDGGIIADGRYIMR